MIILVTSCILLYLHTSPIHGPIFSVYPEPHCDPNRVCQTEVMGVRIGDIIYLFYFGIFSDLRLYPLVNRVKVHPFLKDSCFGLCLRCLFF